MSETGGKIEKKKIGESDPVFFLFFSFLHITCILCIFAALNFLWRHKYPQSDYHCCAIDSRFNNVNERNHGSCNTERLVSRARFFDRLLSLLLPFPTFVFESFFLFPLSQSLSSRIMISSMRFDVRFKKGEFSTAEFSF